VSDLSNRRGTYSVQLPAGGGTVEAVQEGAIVYEKLPSGLAAEAGGKQWLKVDTVALLKRTTGIDISSVLTQSSSGDPTAALSYLQGASRDTHKVGNETIRGTTTTHYAGTLDLNKAANDTADPARKTTLQQTAKLMGTASLPADVWVDGNGRTRRTRYQLDLSKMNLPGATTKPSGVETTTIELYDFGVAFVPPPLPPDDQVADLNQILDQQQQQQQEQQGSSPAAPPAPSPAPLAQVLVPAPAGFEPSTASGVTNGPIDRAAFDKQLGSGSATTLHFVDGFDQTYDSTTGNDSVDVTLFDFASPADGAQFLQSYGPGGQAQKESPFPGIAGAVEYNATQATSDGTYDHTVAAAKGSRVMIVSYLNDASAPPTLLATLATQQYARL
jgi:hypothetical protein